METANLGIPAEIYKVAHQLARNYNPDKVILFGSYATGQLHPWSDYDLLVIKPTKAKFYDRLLEATLAINDYPSRGVDILVYTPAEIKKPNYFIETALKEGRVLYEKPSLRRRNKAMA